MPASILPATDCLTPADLASIVASCGRFEADWKEGRPRRIEDELSAADERIRSQLFHDLLQLEFELIYRAGRHASLDAYLARFPDRTETAREVFSETLVPSRQVLDPRMIEESASAPEGYELLRKLGEGGQAITFLARDLALQRLVVLKRYHGVASSGRREAVLNEGRALARIRSRFVAPCYGVETRGDEIDLVVEYVPGRPLAELTPADRADSRRSARLVEEVAAGLAEVHACGLLHRDIKPQNIILGDDGVPRLVDFGLAVPVASEALHQVSGSPPYMAPEQARGQGERVDARTDVYGLGAVLYFLLTGKPPHPGETLKEALEQARDAPVIPARSINRRVPRALERICMKAMASDPRSRYPAALALGQALRRYRLTRQAAPGLMAVTVALSLLAGLWAFWPTSARPGARRSGAAIDGQAAAEPRSEARQTPPGILRVTRFEIPHFPKLDDKTDNMRAAGLLGRKSFTARLEDDVTVQAELSEPAYSYLIAFRPDGTDELCDPEDEDTPPARDQKPQYPRATETNVRYRLSEGTGLYAFVLVVSREPLLSYREWKKRVGPMAWAARLPYEPGVVWRDEGQGLEPLLADEGAGTRGKGAGARGPGEPAAKLANWLRGLPGIDAVILEAFPVEPAAGP